MLAGCQDLPTPPHRLVPIEILAEPDRDTVRVGDSLVFRIRWQGSETLEPVEVRWSVTPGGTREVGSFLAFRPPSAGKWWVRAEAAFPGGVSGEAVREIVARRNRPPHASVMGPNGELLFRRIPLGLALVVIARVTDPDGDTVPPERIEWLALERTDTTVLHRGDTLRFTPTSPDLKELLLRVSDASGAFTVQVLATDFYDPLTAPRWRIGRGRLRYRLLSGTRDGQIVAHNGHRYHGGGLVCGCNVIGLAPAGSILWDYVTPSVAAPLSVGPANSIYLARGELVSLSTEGRENWILGADAQGGGPVLGPAVLRDGRTVEVLAPAGGGGPFALRRVWPDGHTEAVLPIGGTRSQRAAELAVSPEGSVYLALAEAGPRGRTSIMAIATDGRTRWTRSFVGFPAGLSMAADGTVVVAADSLHALAPNGSSRWSVPISLRGQAVIGNANIAFGRTEAAAVAVSLANGEVVWATSFEAGGDWGTPVLSANGRVYIGAGRRAYGLDAANGRVLWVHEFAGGLGGDALLTHQGLLVVADDLAYIEALDVGAGPASGPWPMAWGGPHRTAVRETP